MDLVAQSRAFVAVAEARSFTRGADACGVPQPVLSRRVSALERHLGGALLRRTTRTVELTELGRRLLPHAAELVALADRLLDLAATHGAELVVALPLDADARALVAARRAGDRAGLSLGFVEGTPDERQEAVRSGRAALAVVARPPTEAPMGVPLGAATASDRPRGRRVHLDQLRSDDGGRPRVVHLDVEDDVPWVRDPLLRVARAAGLRPDQVVVGRTATQRLTAALEHGDVVVSTPTWAAAHDLVWRPLGEVALRRTSALVGAPGTTVDPALDPVLPALARAIGAQVGAGAGASADRSGTR